MDKNDKEFLSGMGIVLVPFVIILMVYVLYLLFSGQWPNVY